MRYNMRYFNGSALLVVVLAAFMLFAMTAAFGQAAPLPQCSTPALPQAPDCQPCTPRPVCGAGPSEENRWHYIIMPYAWLSSINGTVTARGLSASVDASAGVIIDKLNWITQVHVEAQKGDWGFYVDPTFVKLSAGGSIGGVPASVGFTQWLVEFAGTFRILGHNNNDDGPSSSLFALAGGRFWNLENSIDVSDGRFASRAKDWVDPIIGLRYKTGVKPWSFVLQGDIGGFGAASEFTWSVAPVLTYSLSDSGSAVIGYRILGVDHVSGSGTDTTTLDVRYSGPMIGYAFSF